jgi:hypothetical protein
LAGQAPVSVTAAPAGPLPPLPVLVFAGQSNMNGWFTNTADLSDAQKQPQPNVLFYGPNENGSTWGPLAPPTSSSGNKFGPELSTGAQLIHIPGWGLVAEVKYAADGTNLYYDWDPTASNRSYHNLMVRVNAAVAALQTAHPERTVTVAGFFWMQGEGDTYELSHAYAYDENLTAFIAALRADFGDADLPFVFGQIRGGHNCADYVQTAQANVAATVPGVSFIGTGDLPYDPTDGLHFTSAGIYTLGERFGNALAALAALPEKVYLPMGLR